MATPPIGSSCGTRSVQQVDITGWYLSDDPLNLAKWTFPAHMMAPNEFLVVFASGKDRTIAGSEFHTDFQLDKAGGSFLALSRPDGLGGIEIVSLFSPYDRQYEDISFGSYGDTPPLPNGYFQSPTPGAPNDQTAVAGFVADTNFSIDRGFYDAPFDVTITSDTPGASIIYTTDGTLPSEAPLSGTRVNAPDAATAPSATLNITTTTNLRALAVKAGFEPTNVDTHSYIFRAARPPAKQRQRPRACQLGTRRPRLRDGSGRRQPQQPRSPPDHRGFPTGAYRIAHHGLEPNVRQWRNLHRRRGRRPPDLDRIHQPRR